jgi:hypothetical protein
MIMSTPVSAANPSYTRRGSVKSRAYSESRKNWRDYLRKIAMGYELEQDLHRDEDYFPDNARYWLQATTPLAPQWVAGRIAAAADQYRALASMAREQEQQSQ